MRRHSRKKRTGQKKAAASAGWQISRLQQAAIGSIVMVLILSCILMLWPQMTKKQQAAEQGKPAGWETTMQVSAVSQQEKQAVHTLPDQKVVKAKEQDERGVFRIVEVIPHEACSVFPYLVEWGSPEAYDQHVTIGYEGLMSVVEGNDVQIFSGADVPAKKSGPFTRVRGAVKSLSMSDYDVPFTSSAGKEDGWADGMWYRQTQQGSSGLLTEDGYFEYVGEGKGLYYLAAAYVSDTENGEGIRYETRAIARSAAQQPKGELYVAAPAYYAAAEHKDLARPYYHNKPVISQTGYHYTLSFSQKTDGDYVADLTTIRKSEQQEYAYQLVLPDADTADWSTGFSYHTGGNYAIDTVMASSQGRYVRIADGSRPDGYTAAGVDPGYFRLAGPEELGAQHYEVSFTQTEHGSYYANAPTNWTDDASTSYYFTYAGENRGFYDVVFYYSTDSKRKHYEESLEQIAHGMGRYALTSTRKSSKDTPVYEKKTAASTLPADYANIVTNISFTDGVNTGQNDNIYEHGRGVALGGQDESLKTECGGFIFVPLSGEEKMQETRLSSVQKDTEGSNSNTDAYYQKGDRIYVRAQQRRYRYYCRDGFYNNEWFKLLCYANNPEDDSKPYSEIVNGIGYDYQKTAGENLSNSAAQSIIKAFDQNIRLEIIQRTPEQLTVEDVKSAQLIYLSNREGIKGLAAKWNDISDRRKAMGLPGLSYCSGSAEFSFANDIGDDVLMTLYDECIWKRNRALITGIDAIGRHVQAKSNLEKLGFFMNFFEEARNWAYFLPDLYEEELGEAARSEFSKIRRDATVDIYTADKRYNVIYDKDQAVKDVTIWQQQYFIVYQGDTWKVDEGFAFYYDLGETIGTVKKDETKLTINHYIPSFLQDIGSTFKIWQLIQNSKDDASMLLIHILNAQTTAEVTPRQVIYADEFDPDSFSISYQVLLFGSISLNKPKITEVSFTWEGSGSSEWETGKDYAVTYRYDTRGRFTQDGTKTGALDAGKTAGRIIITAKNEKGKTAKAEVWVVIREGFDLN